MDYLVIYANISPESV